MLQQKIKKFLITLHLWWFMRPLCKGIVINLLEGRDRRDNDHTRPDFIEKIKDLVKDKVVCDLGCRKGYFMLDLQKYARRVIGMERERIFCKLARKKGLEVVCGDVLKDKIPEADIYYFWIDGDTEKKVLGKLRAENRKGIMIVKQEGLDFEVIDI